MTRIFSLLLIASSLLIISCSDKNGLTVDEYISANGLMTTELDEGVHMIVHKEGDQDRPTLDQKITIDYVGMLTDESVFDQNEGAEFVLRTLIRGWQIGLREIGRGGEVTLIIPPSAGYGSSERPGIPANSTLVFDITLKDF